MDDLLGWQNTLWGMTQDEVIEVVNSRTLVECAPVDYGTLYCPMHIENTKVGPYFFEVSFLFSKKNHLLERVTVRHTDTPGTPMQVPFSVAMKVLTERFGPPAREGTSNTFIWQFPTTTIKLDMFDIQQVLSAVGIIFFPTAYYHATDIPAF